MYSRRAAMSYREMARRLASLEQLQTTADDGERYVADIGGTVVRYWIDGREVSADEYAWRVPDGPFYVDIGDDDELP